MIMYYSLAFVMFIPIVLALSSIPFRLKQFPKPNLDEPRAQAEQLTGAGGRLVAAQKNAWEALILFAVTLFIAFANNLEGNQITLACITFIIARVGHAVFYVLGLGKLRFIAFLVAIGSLISILEKALF